MMSIIYIALLFMTLWFIFLWCRCKDSKRKIPTNWPIVGMTPGLLVNLHRIHDFLADLLIASGGTFMFKGPWFANVDMLMTCDPANVHHILSKKFPNYGKGPQFKKIFAELGDGIFIEEAES
ncbi:oxygenase [Lithospermum erythrorhizon]|uniref:Oxygenase n=1 Tax=Lithospermum erythrorhizon TaxID=34254 RepID=A0AAV3S1J6_LITER